MQEVATMTLIAFFVALYLVLLCYPVPFCAVLPYAKKDAKQSQKNYLHFRRMCDNIIALSGTAANAPLAQLDRVFDYESKGRGFESPRARQVKSPDLTKRFRGFLL